MARPTDQRTNATEKIVVIHRSQEEGQVIPCGAAWGSPRVGQQAEGLGDNLGESLYSSLCGKGWISEAGQTAWGWPV